MIQLIERIKARYKVLIGLFVVFIVITVPAILLVDNFIHDVILVPIAYYIWLANIIINALPQNCFITFLVVLCLAIAIPSLRKNHREKSPTGQPSDITLGEVSLWEQRLRYLRTGSYSGNRFAYHLGYLVIQILAYEERLTTRSVINALEAGEYDMPANVRQYILMGIESSAAAGKRPFWRKVFLWFKRLFRPKSQTPSKKQNNEIKAVLQYIEQQLKIIETHNDDPAIITQSTQPEDYDVK